MLALGWCRAGSGKAGTLIWSALLEASAADAAQRHAGSCCTPIFLPASHPCVACSVITDAVREQGASIGDLAQRMSRLEASSSAAQQASGAAGAAGAAHCEDVDMAESESRKRARQSAACSSHPEGVAMHAVALSGPGHRQQPQPQLQPPPQQPAEAAPGLTEHSAVAALQWAFMQHRIAEAAAGQHHSCTQAQLLQASSGLGSHLAADGLWQPPAGAASGGLALQPSRQSSMAVLGGAAQVPGAPAISGAAAAAEQGAATPAMQQAAPGGSATAVAALPAPGSSMGVSAAQPGLSAGSPPPGVVPQLQPTSVLQLQPQQLSSMVFHVLMEQWQQGRSAVPARQLASLVCVRSRQAMPLLMLLEDPAMPAQQKSAIVRHVSCGRGTGSAELHFSLHVWQPASMLLAAHPGCDVCRQSWRSSRA